MTPVQARVGRRARLGLALTPGLIIMAIAVVGVLVTRPAGSAPRRPDQPIAAAQRLPAPSLAGGSVLVPPPLSLDRYRGRVLFVNFWASWCVPCRKEAPALARFARLLGADAAFVGVDVNDKRSDALAFLRRFDLTYPNESDPTRTVSRRYDLIGLPTTYVVDPSGRIAFRLLGARTVGSLRQALATLDHERTAE